ncbi:alpha 1,3-glucosidase [Strigomonas culicis]|uniref:Glucosidase II subunit alpha n=1 Tax=Strigomonas culicis TaxID=28005 RepID=S9WAH4_9TRYP|nr:alpha 1,3-glucosidase [Strigomonas culicis]|eukprot:EPY32985.1 alpha 1,3-glucosidase [Strigomonas culicis]
MHTLTLFSLLSVFFFFLVARDPFVRTFPFLSSLLFIWELYPIQFFFFLKAVFFFLLLLFEVHVVHLWLRVLTSILLFSGVSQMRLSLLVLLLSALLVASVANGVQLLKVNTNFTLCAEVYKENILRLTLRRTEWVYEPENVIIAKADRKVNYKCDKKLCHIKMKSCEAKAEVAENLVNVMYVCDGVLTTTASIPLPASGDAVSAVTTFPAAQTMYGLAEHAADLALRPGNEYDMYNTDAFHYPVNSTGALYGSVPFIMAYGKKRSAGLLLLNGSPMKVKVVQNDVPKCEWNAQAGLIDLFFFSALRPSEVHVLHGFLTGHTFMPPYTSLGFHQSRWNYMSTQDCLSVDEGFDTHSMPYDVLWLDIEHTNGRRYFTWDKHAFPDPKLLVQALSASGRKLTTVKDPHVKEEDGYAVHEAAKKNNYYVKTVQGRDFTGHCWPGTSSWPDFLNQRTRSWYATLLHNDHYDMSSDIYTWVDMNEPSVFKGERSSMSLDAVHLTDDKREVRHRVIHNMYSLLSIMAVHQGALESAGRKVKPKRPFILSRSFFPGLQRYAAVWTGDNMAQWSHLASTLPELLSLSMSNIPFVGADIGGFFFNTDEDLFVRWMQSAIFYPFMRSHTHLETKRHEPWTYSKEAQVLIRNSLALRYALIPYLYTAFYKAHVGRGRRSFGRSFTTFRTRTTCGRSRRRPCSDPRCCSVPWWLRTRGR